MRIIHTYIKSIKNDAPASLVVFLVALPLCLGIAMGSQAPLFSGIITGIVGGVIVGLLSGSSLSVSGPAAGLTTIVAAAIYKLPAFEAFLLAVMLCGVFQIILGFLKAGVIGDFVPGNVIKGMLAAIGIILILKQLPHLVGYDRDFEGDYKFVQNNQENTFSSIINALRYLSPIAVVIGLLGLGFQVYWEKFTMQRKGWIKLIPAPLIVVLAGIAINEWIRYRYPSFSLTGDYLVTIPVASSFVEFVSFFRFPDWSQLSNQEVWIAAITLSLVASLETLLSIEAVDELDPYKRVTPTDRELKAQGVGNIICGLLGGLPLTSVIVRSSANVNAGGQTKMAAVFHGLLLLISVTLFPTWLNLIPKSALAAILIFTGFKLAKPALFQHFFRKGWDQFLPFGITILAILFTDLLTGVLIGIAAGLFFVFRSNFKSSLFIINDENKYLFRFRKDVSFLNKPLLKNKLEGVPENAHVLIDAARADFIDRDVIEVMEDFMLHAHLKNITVELKKSQLKNQGFTLPLDEATSAGYQKFNRSLFDQSNYF